MNRLLAIAVALGLGTSAAFAQAAPDAAPTNPPAASSQAPVMNPAPTAPQAVGPSATAPAAQPTGKEVRQQCRADAEAQGLTGPARKAAVQDCFAKARPDLAKREQCRQQGKAQGLADQPLHAFVKSCVAGA